MTAVVIVVGCRVRWRMKVIAMRKILKEWNFFLWILNFNCKLLKFHDCDEEGGIGQINKSGKKKDNLFYFFFFRFFGDFFV